MFDDTPDSDNLNVCAEHGLMKHAEDEDRRCPLCNLDGEYEVRSGEEIPKGESGVGTATDQEIRQRIPAEVMEELLPLMAEYLDDAEDGGDMWITVVGCPKDQLPAGYSQAQERWINAVVYHFGIREKCLTTSGEAKKTIENLREEGYGGDDGE